MSAAFFLRHEPCGLGGLPPAPELTSASLGVGVHALRHPLLGTLHLLRELSGFAHH